MLALMLMVPTLSAEAASNESASKGKVLLVASSTNTLTLKDGKVDPTGYFLDELAVPSIANIAKNLLVRFCTGLGWSSYF